MAELLYRAEEPIVEQVQQEVQQDIKSINGSYIVLNEKLEEQNAYAKSQNEKLSNNSPRLSNLGNPQEQEIPENQLDSKDNLKTEEVEQPETQQDATQEAQKDVTENTYIQEQKEEIDLYKTLEYNSQIEQSQETNIENSHIENQSESKEESKQEETDQQKTLDNNSSESKEESNDTTAEKNEVELKSDVPQEQNKSEIKEEQKVAESEGTAQASGEAMYTVEKRMSLANQLKDQARDLIKEKKYPDALVLYQQALDITNPTYFQYINSELKIQYTQLSTQLLNNLAFCYFHLGNYLISAQISDQTLLIDPTNLKAMYRRAVCYKNMGDYERAFEAIKTAVKSGGNESKDIYSEYEAIKVLYKEYLDQNKLREKEIYGRMMNNSSNKISETKKQQEESSKVEQEQQNLMNSIFFFGSTAVSFLVASKVMKIDVTSKTGFSLSSSLAASVYASYYFGNKWAKGFFGICAFALFGYMGRKYITA